MLFVQQQEYLQSMNQLEIATNEMNAINQQFEFSKQKLAKYKLENQAAIELYNEQMTILCMLICLFSRKRAA